MLENTTKNIRRTNHDIDLNRYWVDQLAEDVSDDLITKYSIGSRVFVRKDKKIIEVTQVGFMTFTELKKGDEVWVMSIPKLLKIE